MLRRFNSGFVDTASSANSFAPISPVSAGISPSASFVIFALIHSSCCQTNPISHVPVTSTILKKQWQETSNQKTSDKWQRNNATGTMDNKVVHKKDPYPVTKNPTPPLRDEVSRYRLWWLDYTVLNRSYWKLLLLRRLRIRIQCMRSHGSSRLEWVSTVECRFEWYVSCKDTRIQE